MILFSHRLFCDDLGIRPEAGRSMQMVRECAPCVCRHESLPPRYAAEVNPGQCGDDLPDGELVACPVDLVFQDPDYQ